MDVITQTNRTMLFEEINPEKLNILTLIGDTKDLESLDDAKIKEIHENLLVRNFDEFLEKFEPVVYSFFNAATQNVSYTLEKPENIPEEYISEIPLNKQNDFLNMLFTLMDSKRAQGIINVDFKFEKILEGLLLKIESEKTGAKLNDAKLSYQTCYRAQGCIAVLSRWVEDGGQTKDFTVKVLAELDANTEKVM